MAEFDPSLISEPPGSEPTLRSLMPEGQPNYTGLQKFARTTGGRILLGLLPGFNQGWEQAKQQQRLELLTRLGALKELSGMPPGTLRKQFITRDLSALGLPEEDVKALASENDEAMASYQRYIANVLSAYPEIGMSDVQNLLKSGSVSLKDILQHGAVLDRQADTKAIGSAMAKVAPKAPAADARGQFFAQLPVDQQRNTGDTFQTPPVTEPAETPQAPSELEQLQAQRDRIHAVLPQIRTEQGLKNAETALKSLDEQINKLSGVTGGLTETIRFSNGNLARIRYNALGQPIAILGAAPGQYDLTEVNGERALVEKQTGEVKVLGTTMSGPLESQVAAAEQAYKTQPTPENKARLDRTQRALQLQEEQRVRIAKATGENAASIPQRPAATEVKDLASFALGRSYLDELTRLVPRVDLKNLVGGFRPWVNQIMQTGKVGPIPLPDDLLARLTPEQERFLALVQDYADTVLRLRSGAQINEQEFQRMLAFLTNPSIRPETFIARLRTQHDLLRAREESYRGALSGAGYRAPQVPSPRLSTPEGAPETQEFNINGQTIRVRPK